MNARTEHRVGDSVKVPIYGECRIIRIFPGHNRLVYECFNGSGRVMVKITGEPFTLTWGEAASLTSQAFTYVGALEKLGIVVPKPRFVPEDNGKGDGTVTLWEFSDFAGTSAEELILEGNRDEVREITRCILQQVATPLFRSSRGDDLPIGIDLIPRNITRDSRGVYSYVDIMPPKMRINKVGAGHKWDRVTLEIPEPTDPRCRRVGYKRHYSKKGLAVVLLVQLCKLRPELRHLHIRRIEEWLAEIGELSTLHGFRNRPSAQIKLDNGGQAATITAIRSMGFLQIYDLRGMACELAWRSLISVEELNRFFADSHFQNQPLDQATMNDLRQRLIRALSS